MVKVGGPHVRRAGVATVVLVAAAFVAAQILADSGWLSTTPPPSDTDPTPAPDVAAGEEVELYRAAFTAWAALALFAPSAVAMFGGWGRTEWWRAWWSAGFVGFAVHMFWSMAVFFDGDIDAMLNTTRVSAFWPGVLLLVWWAIDVLLSWTALDSAVITAQRIAVHVLAFVLFVGGSAGTGETLLIRLIGAALLVAVAAAFVRRWLAMRTS